MTSPVGSIQDGLGKIDPKKPIVAFENNVNVSYRNNVGEKLTL